MVAEVATCIFLLRLGLKATLTNLNDFLGENFDKMTLEVEIYLYYFTWKCYLLYNHVRKQCDNFPLYTVYNLIVG